MRAVAIVGAVRSPVGKRNGGPSGVRPVDLGAHLLTAFAERAPAQDSKPLARLHTCVVVGDDPVVMLQGRVRRIVPGRVGSRRRPAGSDLVPGGGMADATVLELLA